MSTGRHLYVVLGTYERLERYERVDFREARSPGGERLGDPVNVNHTLLDAIARVPSGKASDPGDVPADDSEAHPVSVPTQAVTSGVWPTRVGSGVRISAD